MKKYWNGQKYCECRLVALWNTAIYYNIPVPVRFGGEYDRDCEDACAKIGAAINVDHVIKKLNLYPIEGKLNWGWIKNNCPIEFKVYCHRGYHSTLAVDVNLEKEKILLTNYAKGKLYWIHINRLLDIHNNRANPIKWIRR